MKTYCGKPLLETLQRPLDARKSLEDGNQLGDHEQASHFAFHVEQFQIAAGVAQVGSRHHERGQAAAVEALHPAQVENDFIHVTLLELAELAMQLIGFAATEKFAFQSKDRDSINDLFLEGHGLHRVEFITAGKPPARA